MSKNEFLYPGLGRGIRHPGLVRFVHTRTTKTITRALGGPAASGRQCMECDYKVTAANQFVVFNRMCTHAAEEHPAVVRALYSELKGDKS